MAMNLTLAEDASPAALATPTGSLEVHGGIRTDPSVCLSWYRNARVGNLDPHMVDDLIIASGMLQWAAAKSQTRVDVASTS